MEQRYTLQAVSKPNPGASINKQTSDDLYMYTVSIRNTYVQLIQAARCLTGRAPEVEQLLQPQQQLARLPYGMQQMHHYHL